MESELKQLINKKGSLKGSLTKIYNFVVTTEINNENKIKLEAKLKNLTHVFKCFEDIHFKILEIEHDTDKLESVQKEFNEYEEKYYEAIVTLESKLKEEKHNVNEENRFSKFNNVDIKLPKIEINKFKGDVDQWLKFYETFNSIIHKNPKLGNLQKFHYLKSCLVGEAADVIDQIEIKEDNYDFAWKMLTDRYENNKILIEKHLSNLFKAKKLETQTAIGLHDLYNLFASNLNALKKLNVKVENSDPFLVYLLTTKFDSVTLREWEKENAASKEMPPYSKLEEFIRQKYSYLESFESKQTVGKNISYKGDYQKHSVNKKSSLSLQCIICEKNIHPVYKCSNFLRCNVEKRREIIKKIKCCWQCLGFGHNAVNCTSRTCSKCGGKHNYLICLGIQTEKDTTNGISNKVNCLGIETEKDTTNGTSNKVNLKGSISAVSQEENDSSPFGGHASNNKNKKNAQLALLPTVVIGVRSETGNHVNARFLLDSGSELNFIGKDLVKRLDLVIKKEQLNISGIGGMQTAAEGYVELKINSRVSNFTEVIKCYVLNKITIGAQIKSNIDRVSLPLQITDKLADPDWYKSGTILEGILGAQIFFQVLQESNRFTMQKGESLEHIPRLINTSFGWVVTGVMGNTKNGNCLGDNGNKQVVPGNKMSSKIEEDIICEEIFIKNTQICDDGKYKLTLPLKGDPNILGCSVQGAMKRFMNLENKLLKNPSLRNEYIKFMKEYEQLGHMELVPNDEIDNSPNYYLPHHPVIKDSTTTKVRVVFDASHKTDQGKSLNDLLMTGPVLQNDIADIILSFRFPKFGLSADITKMYRQFWIDESQRDLQRILWRETPGEEIKHYRLRTLTYGTSSAPYLAIRCLREIANEVESGDHKTATIIRSNFYMDDLLTGEDSVEDLINTQTRVEKIFKTRRLILRKWVSNSRILMDKLSTEVDEHYVVKFGQNDTVKTLGITWNPYSDEFLINVQGCTLSKVSKRVILADINGFWDPLGFLAPILIKGKIFLQELWQIKIAWDEELPENLSEKWLEFRKEIYKINQIRIPRRVLSGDTNITEFHGFSDASEKAYGCCIYVRTLDNEKRFTSRLLFSKARVAPLHKESLPRLELLGAVLLAKYMNKIINLIKIKVGVHYWTDSQIVLAWINGHPQQWKTYVANRVARIQDMSKSESWHYIPSKRNPADIVSRGASPKDFHLNKSWWEGPHFLTDNYIQWPSWKNTIEEPPEKRKVTFSLVVNQDIGDLIQRFSSWRTLWRVVALLFRFISNIKNSRSHRQTQCLSVEELQKAKVFLIKTEQTLVFEKEINSLKHKKQVSKDSKLLALSPFLDKNELLRVGGRLNKAQLSEEQKHPIILPYKSKLTELILRDLHTRHFHVGPQVLLTIARQQYWPINGKSATKAIVHGCVICRRAHPNNLTPLMADLPKVRVTPARPFENTGVDFCGPIEIKVGTKRSIKRKAYIAIFICLTTKAVHLELVTDLSSQAFLAALKRFFARRGVSLNIYSDNGTNFVGAQKELRKLISDERIKVECTDKGINWHFIPPNAPHFGGLWESAVKLLKVHARKIMDKMILTFEEAYTVLTQIEACINSRPITSLSDNPFDPLPLTPAHFLVGGSLLFPPEPDLTKETSLTKRWQRLQQLHQEFWKRWSSEYLSSLQKKHKWKFKRNNIPLGTLVLIKDDNLKPMQWKLGRIKALHPGSDGVVRVASIILPGGQEVLRPVVKICPIMDT